MSLEGDRRGASFRSKCGRRCSVFFSPWSHLLSQLQSNNLIQKSTTQHPSLESSNESGLGLRGPGLKAWLSFGKPTTTLVLEFQSPTYRAFLLPFCFYNFKSPKELYLVKRPKMAPRTSTIRRGMS